jgi:hypothetical protein
VKNRSEEEVTIDQEGLLRQVAEEAAKKLTAIEIHSICVLLSMAFGRGTIPSRLFAWYANEMRVGFGLPRITNAVAGNPTAEQKVRILESALDKMGDEALARLIQVLNANSNRHE